MAININPGTPLRHVATFNSSGNWTAPIGTNLAFVSVVGAGSGGYGGGPNFNLSGGTGGVAAAYVQVTGGGTHVVTVGAGGSGGSGFGGGNVPAAGSGGTTLFDGRLSITGATSPSGSRYSASVGTSSASGATTLTTLNPGASTLVSTATITSQTSGGGAGGSGGGTPRYIPRYSAGNTSGNTGSSGAVHIYI